MGKKRRDGRAAKRGNSNSSSNVEARNSSGGLQHTAADSAGTIRQDRGTYRGELRHGKMHGTGTYKWNDGDTYDGEWKNDLKHGRGVYTSASGDVYEGQYANSKRHGRGTFTWEDGDVYVGGWKNNFKHGRGEYRWTDGRAYEGEWADGDQHGKGTMTWPSGKVHEGQWAEGKPHGEGTEKLPSGEIYEGIWVKGEFVQRELRSQRSRQRRLERGATAFQICEHCGVDDGPYKLRVCSNCNLALYCSAACQKAASRSHRRICDIASKLPSRDAERLVLLYDKENMIDVDAGMRYATKYMANMKNLAIKIEAPGKDDTAKLSAKRLSSLLKSKKGALESFYWLSNECISALPAGSPQNDNEVWKELHGLQKLLLYFLPFDDVQFVRDIVSQQSNTLVALALAYLQIDWHKAKTRRAVAEAVSSCKHLVYLNLNGGVMMDADLKVMLNDLPSLRILDLSRDTDKTHEFTDNTCGLIARKCPGLQELCLFRHDQLSVRGIRKVFEGCPHLRSFDTSTRKLSCIDIRTLLDTAPQLMYLSLGEKHDFSDAELDEIIEATGGRTFFGFGSGDRFYEPQRDVVSSKAKETYDRQKGVLSEIWRRRNYPEIANEWADMLEA